MVYFGDVAEAETELEMVERHLRAGRRHLRRQRRILATLRSGGHSTLVAEELLVNLQDLQRLHRQHLARLKHASEADFPPISP